MRKAALPSNWVARTVRAAASFGLVAAMGTPLIGQEVQPRSLADVRDRPNEAPRFMWPDRVEAWRPQIQRGPFVALSATPRMSVEQLASQVDEANEAYVQMSSLWSNEPATVLNRLDAVAVLVHDERDMRNAPPPGVYVDFDGTLHLVLPADGHENRELELELRTGLIRHVLEASCQATALSSETTEELACFIATYGGPEAEKAFDPFAAENEALLAIGPRNEIEQDVALRFLWEGDDAAMAPRFSAAMQAAVLRRDARPLESLLAEAARQAARQEWLANPLAGQPRIENAEQVSPEMAVRQHEMALILKLARRFSVEQRPEITPEITAYEEGLTEISVSAQAASQRTIADLYAQLAATSDWATLDIDGSVLFSTDRERLVELFALAEGRYQLIEVEGRETLVSNWRDGELLTGHLAEEVEYPTRPLATFSLEQAE